MLPITILKDLMSLELLLPLAGLALLDSLNTSTLFMAILILLAARRPASTAWAYALGSVLSFFVVAVGLYLAADAAAEVLAGFTLWVRRILFLAITVFLVVMGIRRFKSRPRHPIRLPAWINFWTAFPVGIMMTLADLPNAFPLFFAVERLIESAVGSASAITILAGYTAIYALPTLLLLSIGLIFAPRVRGALERVLARFTTGYTTPSWKIATVYFLGALASLTLLIVFGR